MASEQTLYTMVALYRLKNGMRTLYDFRPENSGNTSTPSVHTSAFSASSSSTNSQATGSSSSSSHSTSSSSNSSTGAKKAENTPLLFFSNTDKAAVDALPRKLSTEQYVTVLELLDKLEHCDDFEGKSKYKAILEKDKAQIMAIQAKIDKLNQDIMNKLYPFDKLSLKDKAAVYDVVARYESLAPYDQKKILRYEDVIKAKTQIDNLERAVIITVVAAFAAIFITVLVILRIRARRKKKQLLKMPVQETDEEDDKS
jgi:cobalamin biosynthesis Mg chelatase CobN